MTAQDPPADDREDKPDLGARVQALQRWADRFQQRHAILAFPYGVIKKYGDDAGGRQAALITYYGFLSVIPLLILTVYIGSQILRDNADLRRRFIDAVVPETLESAVDGALAAMPSFGLPLVIGIVGMLFTGTGVVFSAYETINNVQGVPNRVRFDFFPRYLRIFAALAVLIVSVALFGFLSVLSTVLVDGWWVDVASAIGSMLVTFGMLVITVGLLSARPGSWRHAWPAALLGSLVVTTLVLVGAQVLAILVSRSGVVYGPFAGIVGLFSLVYLVSQALVFSAEIAVVRRQRLWPRALISNEPIEADMRALEQRARVEERIAVERASAVFDAPLEGRGELLTAQRERAGAKAAEDDDTPSDAPAAGVRSP